MNADISTEHAAIGLAHRSRLRLLEMSAASNSSTHIGGGLSIIEILSVLYGGMMKIGVNTVGLPDRDRFILSKGHGVSGYYAILTECGLLSDEVASSFLKDESLLMAHPVRNVDLGVEASTGSLGHGLAFGTGIALALRHRKQGLRVYVLVGDGECDEGAIWEAARFASEACLDNVTVIIDANGFQSDGLVKRESGADSLAGRWEAFGWETHRVDGHSVPELIAAFSQPAEGKPTCVVASTVKGRGVSFMENDNHWHHSRLTPDNFQRAIDCLKEATT